MNLSVAFTVAALVLFILAALTGFNVVHIQYWQGLVATGLACATAAKLVP